MCAEKAISIDPEDAFNFHVRANAKMGLSRWADGEADCRKALELDPDASMTRNLLVTAIAPTNSASSRV